MGLYWKIPFTRKLESNEERKNNGQQIIRFSNKSNLPDLVCINMEKAKFMLCMKIYIIMYSTVKYTIKQMYQMFDYVFATPCTH